ncbi:MAG: hypothetical protein Q9178_006074 [Gyalolechia marmorata]
MDSYSCQNHWPHPEQPTSFTNGQPGAHLAFPTNDFDTWINQPAPNNDNGTSNTTLNPTLPPVSSSMPAQHLAGQAVRFHDPDIAQLANSIHQGLMLQPSNESTVPLRNGLKALSIAMKARMHHTGLVNRIAMFLDSFTADSNDKSTLPADQAMSQLYKRITAAHQDNERVQQANMVQREENDRLRRELDFYRTKAHYSVDNLNGFCQHLSRQLELAHYEVDRRGKLVEGLRGSIATLSMPWKEAAPKVLSAQEVIQRHTGWLPSSTQEPAQAPQSWGYSPAVEPDGFFQQKRTTPPTVPRPSPMLATPPYEEARLHQAPQTRITTQAVSLNALVQATPRVSVDLTSDDREKTVQHGVANSQTESFQQRSSPATDYLTPPTNHTVRGSSSSTGPYVLRSSLSSESTNGGQTTSFANVHGPSPPNHLDSTYACNVQDPPRWVTYPQQYGQNVTRSWMTNSAATQQQPSQKRGFEHLDEAVSNPDAANQTKKAKTAATAKKATAPKKAPVKKTAPKKTEPKRKATRKSKKEKDFENEWIPELVRLQDELLGRPKDTGPSPEAPKAAETTVGQDEVLALPQDPEPASEAAKAPETITIPDEAADEEDEEDDVALQDLMEAYYAQEEEEAKAAGNA